MTLSDDEKNKRLISAGIANLVANRHEPGIEGLISALAKVGYGAERDSPEAQAESSLKDDIITILGRTTAPGSDRATQERYREISQAITKLAIECKSERLHSLELNYRELHKYILEISTPARLLNEALKRQEPITNAARLLLGAAIEKEIKQDLPGLNDEQIFLMRVPDKLLSDLSGDLERLIGFTTQIEEKLQALLLTPGRPTKFGIEILANSIGTLLIGAGLTISAGKSNLYRRILRRVLDFVSPSETIPEEPLAKKGVKALKHRPGTALSETLGENIEI